METLICFIGSVIVFAVLYVFTGKDSREFGPTLSSAIFQEKRR